MDKFQPPQAAIIGTGPGFISCIIACQRFFHPQLLAEGTESVSRYGKFPVARLPMAYAAHRRRLRS
jgi:hypothetical protein